MKFSLGCLSRFFRSLAGLEHLCLSDEDVEGIPGEGSIGRSLCAAGVDRWLRSRAAMEPG